MSARGGQQYLMGMSSWNVCTMQYIQHRINDAWKKAEVARYVELAADYRLIK